VQLTYELAVKKEILAESIRTPIGPHKTRQRTKAVKKNSSGSSRGSVFPPIFHFSRQFPAKKKLHNLVTVQFPISDRRQSGNI
jgi:hypothetical protein